MEYTTEQREAIDFSVTALNKGDSATVAGYAGTGKTTVIKDVVRQTKNSRVVTFTGKAAAVLREKGVTAQTIHSSIYQWDSESGEFYLKDDPECDCFIIDEGSMVGRLLYRDLLSYEIPILSVGDPGQLEPVNDSSVNLLENPDILLEEIHRQAEDSPIIRLATQVRRGIPLRLSETPGCRVVPFSSLASLDIEPDIYLCGYNRTRVEINQVHREVLGFNQPICPGDRLIIKCNDPSLGLYNGQLLDVLKVLSVEHYRADCVVKFAGETGPRNLKLWTRGLLDPKSLVWENLRCLRGKVAAVDYAFGITVHASQGSEWNRVALIAQAGRWNQSKWLYTGITRAAKDLTVFI